MPTALIAGIAGQDGHYLAELLHGKGYEVWGLDRSSTRLERDETVDELPFAKLVHGDLRDSSSLTRAIEQAQPDEIYNLAAISFVASSFDHPMAVTEINGLGPVRILEAIRAVGGGDGAIRMYQASSSEIFGSPEQSPQDEDTRLFPRNPYGCAKAYAHHSVRAYREQLGIYACSGILYNHESPRRGREFVTRKITNAAARISLGLQDSVSLGNLDAVRDWGYAGDYVHAMWLMLQQDEPNDYVIASGDLHSVRDFVAAAFSAAGVEDWDPHVTIDPRFVRPVEDVPLHGDPTRARVELGWVPEVSFKELVTMMVEHDLAVERTA